MCFLSLHITWISTCFILFRLLTCYQTCHAAIVTSTFSVSLPLFHSISLSFLWFSITYCVFLSSFLLLFVVILFFCFNRSKLKNKSKSNHFVTKWMGTSWATQTSGVRKKTVSPHMHLLRIVSVFLLFPVFSLCSLFSVIFPVSFSLRYCFSDASKSKELATKRTGTSPATTKWGVCNIQATCIPCVFPFGVFPFGVFAFWSVSFIVFSFARCVIILQQIAVKPNKDRLCASKRKLLQNGPAQTKWLQNDTKCNVENVHQNSLISSFVFMCFPSLHFTWSSACYFILFCLLTLVLSTTLEIQYKMHLAQNTGHDVG